MPHKDATSAYSKAQREHRDLLRQLKATTAKANMDLSNAAASIHVPGEGADIDVSREDHGTKNRPAVDSGYTLEHLKIMNDAGVGPED